jgi:hypothetical protein
MLGDDLLDLLWVRDEDLTPELRARLEAAEEELRRLRPGLYEGRTSNGPGMRLVKVLRED